MSWLSKRFATLAVLVVGGAFVAGGIAYASIPDAGTGKYHACVMKNGQIRVIDPATDACSSANETEITFNKQGPQGDPGLPGAPGVSPTVQQLAAGDAHCSAGGAAITDANGSTAYVCSGQPFSGTFTSPNGQYSIRVLDSGVTVMGPAAKITVTGNDVKIDHADDVSIRASNDVALQVGNDLTAKAASDVDLEGSSTATVKAAGTLALQGSTVDINGSGCAPAARVGDHIAGTADGGGTVTGSILSGSTSVCIG